MALRKENGAPDLPANGVRKDKHREKKRLPRREVQPLGQRLSSWRWMTAMITWFGFINATLMRNSFNMALVCMTGSAPPPRNSTSNSNNSAVDPFPGEFDWDETTQGIILSSVLYLGFLAPAISGVLAKKFGAKRIVGISMMVSSVMNILTPFGARAHLYVLIAMRVVIGCFSGTILPSTQALWGYWAPDQEKVQLVSWTLSGVNIGSLVSSLISGFLCLIPLDRGWPFVFYVFGGIGIIWCIVWWILIYDTPEEHKWITEKEKLYIRDNIKTKADNSTFIPYKAVITSVPMWAFVFIQTIHMWCATIFFTYLPKYMRDVLRFPIEQNAVVSSVPFASRFIGVIFWGIMADQMDKRNVSPSVNRKVVQSVGFLTCAAITAGIGYISEDARIISVVLFVITMFFQSCTFAGSSIVPLDMAPRLASVISGVFLGVGGFLAIFAPITVSFMTPDGSLEQWRGVFFMLTGCYVVGVAVFVFFGSAELQPWGKSIPVDNIVSEPSTNNLAELDKSATDGACVNGHIGHDGDVIRRRPKIMIEREISVVSTESFKSNNSNAPGTPVVKITSVYFLGEEMEGTVNPGFLNNESSDVIQTESTEREEIWYTRVERVTVVNEKDEVTRF